MKTHFSLFALLSMVPFLTGCPFDETTNDGFHSSENSILLLKVDFMTNNFEGGKILSIPHSFDATDSLPISIDYDAPGDFGGISLYVQPSDQMIFDGTIIWAGSGEIKYPTNFVSPENQNFPRLDSPLEQPINENFINVFDNIDESETDYNKIWNAINKLKIVKEYKEANPKIGFFLYTPSVGIGDPNEWDWFVIMGK